MLNAEVAQRIREIEIFTRRLVSGSCMGETTSLHKGFGLDFDQLRDYQYGDDVRFIDWRSSARADRLLIKQYIEERNRTIIVALDCSASTFFGSDQRLKYDAIAEIAAVLALIGNYGKDRVGLLLFSDDIELYLPPARGSMHTRFLLEKIFTAQPVRSRTNLAKVCEYLVQLKQKNAVVFMLSDFIDQHFEKPFACVARMYDLIAIRMLDAHEQTLPPVGLLRVQDCESGQWHTLDFRPGSHAKMVAYVQQGKKRFEEECGRAGVDLISMQPQSCSIASLVQLFARRMRY